MKIIINGVAKDVAETSLEYQQIVDIADSGRSREALHTVVYSTKRISDNYRKSGCIAPGQTLELEEGMTITALVTDGA